MHALIPLTIGFANLAGDALDAIAAEDATALAPLFEPLDLRAEQLSLTARGSWQLTLDTGATIELGRGTAAQLLPRVERLVRTLTQVTSKYGRRPDDLVSADLRHGDGYAVRLRGVGTVSADAQKK